MDDRLPPDRSRVGRQLLAQVADHHLERGGVDRFDAAAVGDDVEVAHARMQLAPDPDQRLGVALLGAPPHDAAGEVVRVAPDEEVAPDVIPADRLAYEGFDAAGCLHVVQGSEIAWIWGKIR